MSGEINVFRVVAEARGASHDLLVEDVRGIPRLFIRAQGTVTKKPLNNDLVNAMLRGGRLQSVNDDSWYSLDDLRGAVGVH